MSDTTNGAPQILPTSQTQAEADAALDLILGDFVASVTGMDRSNIRRRWQRTPPKQLPADDDWCALSVTEADQDTNAIQQFNPDGDGSMTLRRHETLSLFASFYGPNATQNASLLRDGLMVGQNRRLLWQNGMAYLDCGRLTRVPSLVNQQWLPRTDITLRLRRQVVRTYPIHSVLESTGQIETDATSLPFDTENARS